MLYSRTYKFSMQDKFGVLIYMVDNELIAIDIFSGCGGLSYGLRQAGFKVAYGVEIDEKAVETYRVNHPTTKVVASDILKVTVTQILRDTGLKKGQLDLLAGCAPCQGFSKHMHGRENDPRNTLILELLRIVKGLLPKTFFMENVPGLAYGIGKPIFDRFCNELTYLGYRYNFKKVNAVDYGVPQFRERLVFVASRIKKVNLDVFLPTHWDPSKYPNKQPWKTVRDSIYGLPEVKIGEKSVIPNHLGLMMSDLNRKRIAAIPKNGGSRIELPKELQLTCHSKNVGYKDVYGRMKWDEPCRTLTTGCCSITKGRYGHPEQDRAISPYEASLLQSFPKDYVFPHTPTITARQIGNAVPPEMAKVIIARLKKSLIKRSLKNGS